MSVTVTLVLTLSGVLLTTLFGWLGARPPRDPTRPRMVPWRFLMLIVAALTILIAAHLVSLLKQS
jgi:hypothetical protein